MIKRHHLLGLYALLTNGVLTLSTLLRMVVTTGFLLRPLKHRLHDVDKFSKRGLLVFGNGPSLAGQIDLYHSAMNDFDVLCVNYFGLTSYFCVIKPRYYMITDHYFFYDGYDDARRDELLTTILDVEWDMVLLIPYAFRRSAVVRQIADAGIKLEFINTTPVDGFKVISNLLYHREFGMPFPQTVINAAIFVGLALPYERIFLLGVEQSWLKDLTVKDDNSISVELKHFYHDKANGLQGHATLATLSTFLYTQYRCFRSHECLAEYARYKQKEILNLTPGSYIDSYPRKEIKSAMIPLPGPA